LDQPRTVNAEHLVSSYERLAEWCRRHDYAGYDPFDALNSRIFQATPLRRSRAARLVWTQVFKRAPLNLRPLALVPAGKNPKGMALFALAALARFRAHRTNEAAKEARARLAELLAAQLTGWSGAAWGYDFDWQGRAFYAPRGTPAVVPTAFAARAMLEAACDLHDDAYLRAARSACDFVIKDLRRSEESEAEICFSYTPLDQTRVFNASLLAAETLGGVGALTGEADLCELARRAAHYVIRRQRADGSWAYGADSYQSWADNFHTAFVLVSLSRILKACGERDAESSAALGRGYRFWRERFFLADGWPKYYHDRLYPADTHAAAAGVIAALELSWIDAEAPRLAERIALWAARHLQDRRGFFYYQKRRFYTVRTPYMRWSQAWMLYALARLLEASGRWLARGEDFNG
jgi:hypothetical protein